MVNAADGSVVALDASTGRRAWKTALPRIDAPVTNWRSRPTVEGELVLVGTIEGDVHALRADDGGAVWSAHVDDLGVWSPPLLYGDTALVHGGLHLYAMDAATGAVRWATAVGFGSYSEPVHMFDRIVVSGGDPPLDGYLAMVDPDSQQPSLAQLTSDYEMGDQSDGLDLALRLRGEEVLDARIDLRPFGRSGDERLVPNRAGAWIWSGTVDAGKRLGETTVYGSALIDGARRQFAVCIDAGSATAPSVATARTLEDAELPVSQADAVSSGSSVIEALARSYGRDLDRAAIADAGRHMVEQEGTPPVHKWRGGAGRIAMASGLPLRKSVDEQPSRAEIAALLDRWEAAE